MPGTTDTVKAMLTPGEFVIRKEAVDMIGVPTLEKLNDMPEAGGHSEIDRLIAMATLKNMTGMYGGGMVNAKQYMGGGMVNEYKHGGKVHKNLKPIPKDNPGLAKLPEKVRNKMGYMQEGGEVEDSLMGMMYGGKAKKKKKYGYQDGGSVNMDDVLKRKMLMEQYSNVFDQNISLDDRFSNFTKAKMAMDKASGLFKDFKESETGYSASGNRGNLTDQEYFRGMKNLQNEKDMLLDMLKSSISSRQPEGMQEGGAVQDSSMMMQANPFVPFDQRPPSSGEMMSPIPSGMEQGDMMRIIRDEREVLDMQDVELLRQKAQNALTRFQLDSLMQKATLDSLINQGSGDAMRIQRSPNELFSFPNTPAQENFMQKYKEEMIDPTYFPEGN